jgi:hypothetical protein
MDLFMAPFIAHRPFADSCCALAMCSLVLLLIGWGGRAVAIIQFLAVVSFLTRNFPTVSVNEQLYLILSFWTCFLPIDRRLAVERNECKAPPAAWPLHLLAINIGVYIFSAGLFKLDDPRWISGTFLQLLIQSQQFSPAQFANLATLAVPLKMVNYGIMAFELLWLPLFYLPKTRTISLALLFSFFFGLIVPIRLDWIGEMGLCYVLALASMSPSIAKYADAALARFTRRTKSSFDTTVMTSPAIAQLQSRPTFDRLCFAFVLALLMIGSFNALALSPWRLCQPNNADSLRDNVLRPLALHEPAWLRSLIGHTVFLGPKNMFTSDQFKYVKRAFSFRIIVHMKDGRILEPVKNAGTWRESGALGFLNIKYGCLLFVAVCKVLDSSDTDKAAKPEDLRNLEYVMQWAADRAGTQVEYADLIAAPEDEAGKIGDWHLYYKWTPERGLISQYQKSSLVQHATNSAMRAVPKV